jgi:undecaprenyl-diphosphatase
MSMAESETLLVSSVVAFASALAAIRFLLKFVSNHSFAVFAWYRIVFGGLILLTWQMGWVQW